MIIDPKILENSKNKQINSWPKYNLITLDKMMINIWTKETIDLRYEKG